MRPTLGRGWHRQLTPQIIATVFRHPLLISMIPLGVLTSDEVQRRLVRKDLDLIRRRHSRILGGDVGFLMLPQDQVQTHLRLISPSRRESSSRVLSQWQTFLYAAVRSSRPRIVVETGVLYGSSSAAILQALEDNKAGRLISIDLPAEQHSKIVISGRTIQAGLASPDEVIGSHVPYELRKRWDLRLGDSMKVLPRVLQEHSPISAFVHDSLHTYDHMTAEYSLAYDALDMEGLLISDDVEYNSAWHDFAALKDERYIVLSKGTEGNKFAFLRKSRGAAV